MRAPNNLPDIMRGVAKRWEGSIKAWVSQVGWKKASLTGGVSVIGALLLVQAFYPSDRLLPFARVDGVGLGFETREQAAAKLDTAYDNYKFSVYLGKSKEAHSQPTLREAGVIADNAERLQGLNYPWYARIVPTSLLWAGNKSIEAPNLIFGDKYKEYLSTKLMPVCSEKPVDASLKAEEGKLVVIKSKKGGECEEAAVDEVMRSMKPSLQHPTDVHIDLKEIDPKVTDQQAEALAAKITTRVQSGVPLQVGGQAVTIPSSAVLSWMEFTTANDQIAMNLSAEKADTYLGEAVAPKVAIAPGTSYITTRDFEVVSSQVGASGQALNVVETLNTIEAFINGTVSAARTVTRTVPPKAEYTRSYSSTDTGLNALLENYAKDHKGTFGISFAELSGKKRRANYNGDKQFVTASTYKLFVAYGVLKRVEAGKMEWGANQNCFNRMIINSDNPCAEAFLDSIGLTSLSNEIKSLGLKHSNFTQSGGPFTTANDQVLFMGMLESSQSLSGVSRDRFLGALKQNVYRSGIPAGVNGVVANKVGFLNGLLHDTAIVYSPSGTYVLSVLTEGSSWAAIADLAKQIDQLHKQ